MHSLNSLERRLGRIRARMIGERVVIVRVPVGTPLTDDARQALLHAAMKVAGIGKVTERDTVIYIHEDGKGNRAD